MTDIERAKAALGGHSLALCGGGERIVSDARGISPMLDLLAEGRDLSGMSAADRIVGKAAALLFVLAGIREVYAEVLSEGGAAVLRAHGIPYSCGVLAEHIVNRRGDGICPMEEAVSGISDPEKAFFSLSAKRAQLRAGA